MLKKILLLTILVTIILYFAPKIYAMCGMPGCEHKLKAEEKHMHHTEKTNVKKEKDPNCFVEKIYTCPMHPEVKSQKPGRCPKCKMKLEPKEILMTYKCPNCDYHKKKKGICPDCKTKLEKVECEKMKEKEEQK